MNKLGAIAGLVVGLLLGLAVGVGLAPETAAPPVVENRPAPVESAPANEAAETPTTEPGDAPPPKTLDDIIEEVSIPELLTGEGEVGGVVLTAEGEPLAGVVVTAEPDYPHRAGRELGTSARVEFEMRKAKWLEESRLTATTGADGAYRFTGLHEDSRYRIEAKAEGWTIGPRDEYRWYVRPTTTCDFIAMPRSRLVVNVRLEDGSVPESARVLYRTPAMVRGKLNFARDGRRELDLAPATWEIYAIAGADTWNDEVYDLRSETRSVTIEQGIDPEPITLVLKKTPGIEGTITRPEGFAMPMFDVFAQLNPEPVQDSAYFRNYGRVTRPSIDRSGDVLTYRFRNLAPGNYRVMLVLEDHILEWHDVTVGQSRVTCDLAFPQPSEELFIPLRVYNHLGEVVRDVEIHRDAIAGSNSSGSPAEPLVAEDGTLWVMRHPDYSKRKPIDYHELQVTSAKWGEKTVRCERDQTGVVEVHLSMPATVKLVSSNFNEHPGRSSMRWFVHEVDATSYSWSEPGSQTSPVEFGAVEPGEYELVLRIKFGNHRSHELIKEKVTLAPGENVLYEDVPPLHKVMIRKPADFDGRLSLESGRLRISTLDFVDGVYTLRFAPEGEYLLSSDSGVMAFRVDGDVDVTYEPREYDCFHISLRQPAGVINGLGIEDGDKLVEIDGEALEFSRAGQMAIFNSLKNDSVTWTVVRAGRRVAVTFDGSKLWDTITEVDLEQREHITFSLSYLD